MEAVRYANEDRSIILVGHAGHDEVIGTMGEVPGRIQLVGSIEEAEKVQVPDPDRVAVTTQTTLGVDDANVIIEVLRRRFPNLITPTSDDICYATQNRQTAVKLLAEDVDLVLVLGSDNSSNSRRLREVAEGAGAKAFLIDDATEIQAGVVRRRRMRGHHRGSVRAGISGPTSVGLFPLAGRRACGRSHGHR